MCEQDSGFNPRLALEGDPFEMRFAVPSTAPAIVAVAAILVLLIPCVLIVASNAHASEGRSDFGFNTMGKFGPMASRSLLTNRGTR
jgi:hypothetical protein